MDNHTNRWPAYRPQAIEPKWQQSWEQSGLYLAASPDKNPRKFACLDFFPYPSGEGLHVGHCRNYIPTDVVSRLKRMQGYNVLHPMGWDAFGEPAEQFAVQHGVHPSVTTARNTANFRRQLTSIGTGYDWSREIDSSDPSFYRWTQWFFLLLYRRGLAYRDFNYQWWCPTCQTSLSSHEAAGGVCWRGHAGVTRRKMPAWYFRITAYADELLSGLDEIDWPQSVKAMQRNWIGRSEGAEVQFPVIGDQGSGSGEDGSSPIPGTQSQITVFTTRPDTLYGVTFLALAPEHSLVDTLTMEEQRQAMQAYREAAARSSEIERMDTGREKTGVFTGAWARHPLTGERLPVWVADYVLPGYGTGAIMGVPAHDERDYVFARRFGLPVKTVIVPGSGVKVGGLEPESAYTENGVLVNSGPYDSLSSEAAGEEISAELERCGTGGRAVRYRMRDWLISRQRYWGTPIPIVHCPACGEVPLPEADLPLLLPEMQDFEPDGSGRSPLARLPEYLNTTCPHCGGPAERETDTMGGFACSSWYYLRYTSPHYDQGPFEQGALRYWMPVDLYMGGAEHAVLHLLYARFWTKVMADEGLLPFREPFLKLRNQGQLLAPDGQRMSKSRGNVITPESVLATYGADALRVYEMFMAPFDQDIGWNTQGIQGARRFLNRIWVLYQDTFSASAQATGTDPDLERALHRTVRQVQERIESLRLNTMVSALMEFSNLLVERQRSGRWRTATFHSALKRFLLLLAPAVPHLAEELWERTGQAGSVHQQCWPSWDPVLAQEVLVEIAVQVDGKVRDVILVPVEAAQEEVQALALELPKVRERLEGKSIRQIFFVPGRIMNIVTK